MGQVCGLGWGVWDRVCRVVGVACFCVGVTVCGMGQLWEVVGEVVGGRGEVGLGWCRLASTRK